MARRPRWLLLAALGAAALYALSRWGGRRPQLYLENYLEKNLPPGWAPAAKRAGFAYIAPKVIQSTGAFRPGEAASIFAQGDAAGLKRAGTAWVYARTQAEARAEGSAAALISRDLGLRFLLVNAEAAWLGVEGKPHTEDPVGAMETWVRAFRQNAPGVKLAFQGYGADKGRPYPIIPLLQLFDIYAPMNYGTKASTIAKKYTNRAQLARAARIPYWPAHGTGREEKPGKVWGFAYNQTSGPGLFSLVANDTPAGLGFYQANGSRSMLLEGNAINPPLVAQAPVYHGRSGPPALT